jgi:hypothetical protein
VIPSTVQILGAECFSSCKSLSSITFEANSDLKRIESKVFYETLLESILIPSTLLFIASDAIQVPSQTFVLDGNSCPEFDRWLQLKRSDIAIDFRPIQRVSVGLWCLSDYVVNLSAFEERAIICESDQIYHRIEDELLVFMKSKPLSENVSESEIEKLINLRHPCIAAPIGFVLPIGSGSPQELKFVRLYVAGCSLLEVISLNPIWWTSTVKAKAVAGIVLGLRFAESFGLGHGGLTANNIVFDSDHCIQIVDFKPIQLEAGESESGEGTSKRDIRGFASLLFEILFGRPARDETDIPTALPNFVSEIIEAAFKLTSKTKCSFQGIFETLKRNDFRIQENVDSAEVAEFVKWVESAEYPEK